jgi:hypothetical protein
MEDEVVAIARVLCEPSVLVSVDGSSQYLHHIARADDTQRGLLKAWGMSDCGDHGY